MIGCERPGVRHSFCNKHDYRFRRYGDPLKLQYTTYGEPQKFVEQLASNPPDTDDCVEWPFTIDANGYALVGRRPASRVVLEKTSGKTYPRTEMDCCHNCNNRSCINPRHLRWGTRLENMQDKIKAGTNGKKLTADSARAVFLSAGTYAAIAARFNISVPTVCEVKTRRTWKEATEGL